MPELDELYRQVVLDHYRRPRGTEPLAHPNLCSEGKNPLCGDEVEVAAEVEDGRIAKIQVRGRGCSISVASGSMMAELMKGKTLQEAQRLLDAFKKMMRGEPLPEDLDLGDLEALEGVQRFPVRIKCALLAWTTLEEALNHEPS
jgi:nitrogen fixation NifU-like protein